jgi:hypothetical protein
MLADGGGRLRHILQLRTGDLAAVPDALGNHGFSLVKEADAVDRLRAILQPASHEAVVVYAGACTASRICTSRGVSGFCSRWANK